MPVTFALPMTEYTVTWPVHSGLEGNITCPMGFTEYEGDSRYP